MGSTLTTGLNPHVPFTAAHVILEFGCRDKNRESDRETEREREIQIERHTEQKRERESGGGKTPSEEMKEDCC